MNTTTPIAATVTSHYPKDRVNATIQAANGYSGEWEMRQFMMTSDHLQRAHEYSMETYMTNVPVGVPREAPRDPPSDLEIAYKSTLRQQITRVAPVVDYWPGRRY